jgi:hypothetical protein
LTIDATIIVFGFPPTIVKFQPQLFIVASILFTYIDNESFISSLAMFISNQYKRALTDPSYEIAEKGVDGWSPRCCQLAHLRFQEKEEARCSCFVAEGEATREER